MEIPEQKAVVALNPNSYLSIGLVIMLLGGILWIKDGQAEMRLGMISVRNEIGQTNAGLKADIADLRRELALKTSDRLTGNDFFRWAVQLQKVNGEAGIKLIVPEPTFHP